MKQSPRAWAIDFAAILIGCLVMALGNVLFTVPNHIAPGGVTGLGTALSGVTGLSVGAWTLIINVPLIAVAWWKLGFRPLIKTIAGTLLLSVLIDLMTPVIPPYTNNPLLAAVLGGVLIGAGMGAIFARGGSTGGTDLVSLLLNRAFPNVSIGMLLLCVDALVVVFAVLVFRDIEVALYSIVTLYVTTKAIDGILQGIDHAKVLYVITDREGDVLPQLTESLGIGVTVLPAEGGYTGKERRMLVLVVRRSLFTQVIRAIRAADPEAFFFAANATEVYGEGFKS